MAAPTPKAPPSVAASSGRSPLIPLTVVDAPSQRLWAVSGLVLVQSYKLYLLLTPEASLSLSLLLDLGVILVLSRLRIPRLDFSDAKWSTIGIALALLDWLLLGGWRSALNLIGLGSISTWISTFWSDTFSRPLGLSENRVRINDLIRPTSHLLGQHTIHILPYSTATFSNNAPSCHCIGNGVDQVKIPIFLNNTEPTVLQYSVTSFEDSTIKTLHNFTIPKSSLISIGGGGSSTGHDALAGSGNEALSWRDEVEEEVIGSQRAAGRETAGAGGRHHGGGTVARKADRAASGMIANAYRSSQQRIFDLPISQVGRIKLERVVDKSKMDARISRSEVLIVQCPTTTFTSIESSQEKEHRCPGEQTHLNIQVSGLAPLEVSYRRKFKPSANAPRNPSSASQQEDQSLKISHISSSKLLTSPLYGASADNAAAGNTPDDALAVVLNRRRATSAARDQQAENESKQDFSWAMTQTEVAPISLDLQTAGSYAYEIESVKDACGNTVGMADILKHHQQQGGRASHATQAAKKMLTSSGKQQESHSSPPQAVKQIEVHPRAHAKVVDCSADRPLKLLRGGPAKQITLKATNMEAGADWSGVVHYEPDQQEQKNGKIGPVAESFSKNVTFGSDGLAKIEAAYPGNYIFESISGKFCAGEIGSPWSCPVIEVPAPSADISFSSIEDVCAGPVGVKALAVLSGTPPFRLQYEIRRSGQQPIRQDRIIQRTREEFEFRPSTEGAVQYRFTGLADANYRGLKLDGPIFEQTVHPLAKAQFVQPSSSPSNKMVMRSCEGNQVKADVQLEGTGPFDLTYVVRTGSGKASAEERVVKSIQSNRHSLNIDLPEYINSHGGSMTASLVSIKDGKGCERSLATSDLNIEIRRVKPTAGFIFPGQGKIGETVLLQGKEGQLPVRLQGEGPWKVEYLREGDSMPVQTTIRQAESALTVDRPGLYSLVSVKDAFCDGSIVQDASQWRVSMRERPSVRFNAEAGTQAARNGSLLRPAVCRGTPDGVELRLSGHFPVEVTYEQRSLAWIASSESAMVRGGGAGRGAKGSAGSRREGSGVADGELGFLEMDGEPSSGNAKQRSTFSAAQDTTIFQLSTEAPGWHVYELLQVGDTSYPLSNIPSSPGAIGGDAAVRVEQMVHPLPSAGFAAPENNGRKRAAFCVGDTLASGQGSKSAAPTVHLSGTPPFTLEFELSSSNSQASSARFVRSGIKTHSVQLEVDEQEAANFKFDSTGEWKFKILSLQDGNGCATSSAASLGQLSSGNAASTIEVADTASIAPVGTRQDYCVGETVEFMLFGSSPWSVSYNFNGHKSSATVRQPIFSRVAEKAGVLEIASVAHQQNKCQRAVLPSIEEGMRKVIHPLPTAKVTGGGNYVEDLREGGQAEIKFSLSGTPPFSLTYQRLEAADIYSHPKVLETHTIAGILENEYIITTNQEGTWRVTWLQDRWCSVSIDGTGRHTSEGRARLALTEK
ncbi:unnamed protein product [Sympodiomycopsis kandeliae]